MGFAAPFTARIESRNGLLLAPAAIPSQKPCRCRDAILVVVPVNASVAPQSPPMLALAVVPCSTSRSRCCDDHSNSPPRT
jgi:hypothetical protein